MYFFTEVVEGCCEISVLRTDSDSGLKTILELSYGISLISDSLGYYLTTSILDIFDLAVSAISEIIEYA